jgi:hypothetical protein
LKLCYADKTDSSRRGRTAREGGMLNGLPVLGASLAILVVIWIMVLWGSRYFGSPPEH